MCFSIQFVYYSQIQIFMPPHSLCSTITLENRRVERREKKSLMKNRSCHLRDRDISLRAAITIFNDVNDCLDKKMKRLQKLQEIHHLLDGLGRNLKRALYHASMAFLEGQNMMKGNEISLEEQVISDFLLTFNAACNNIKYLTSHSLFLHELREGDQKQTAVVKVYTKQMLALDDDSIKKFVEQINTRITLFNRTMKIQK